MHYSSSRESLGVARPPSNMGNLRWEFGRRVKSSWQHLLHLPGEPYLLNGLQHAGMIVGLSEQGIHMSQLRIAVNAARAGWKVVLFDPQSSARKAADFIAAMRQAGSESIYVYPGTQSDAAEDASADGTLSHASHTVHKVQRRRKSARAGVADRHETTNWHTSSSPFPLSILSDGRLNLPQDLDTQMVLLKTLHDSLERTRNRRDTPPRDVPYNQASAVYLGFNVWHQTHEVRRTASTFLTDFARFLSTSREEHVLLLIEHPALLFEMEEICSLFALLEQTRGSMFVSARSVADFGKEAARLLKNAQTMIVHRSSTTMPFEPYVSLPDHHPFFSSLLHQLESDECFVLHGGQATHVRVNSVQIDPASSTARVPLWSPAPKLPSWDDLDIEEDLLTSVFGPERWDVEESEQEHPPISPPGMGTVPW